MDAVNQEIRQALKALGYKTGEVEIATESFHRLIVWVNDVRIGIYDLDKHKALDKVTKSAATLLRDMEALQSVERSVAKHDGK